MRRAIIATTLLPFLLLPHAASAAANQSCADFDGNGVVNGSDLTVFAGAFTTTNPRYDLNGDGIVNGFDLVLFSSQFSRTCDPSAVTPEQAVLVNAVGLPVEPCLEQSARAQAQYEASVDTATHLDANGNGLSSRACGYPYAIEEIPWGGDGTGQPVGDALQASPEWALMMASGYTEIGAACTLSGNGTWYWTIIEAHP